MIEAAPWTQTPQAILEHYGVDHTLGLSSEQATRHAGLYGKNGFVFVFTSLPYLD
jgi:hypothetical protein